MYFLAFLTILRNLFFVVFDLTLICFNLFAATIDLFRETLDKVVILAVLMPIVASMGGVAATQTLTIMVRGISLGQIHRSNLIWLASREALVGLGNGLIWAIVVALIVSLWFQDIVIAQIIAIAKTFPLSKIMPLLEIGHFHFGENIKAIDIELNGIQTRIQELIYYIPNIVHHSVPDGKDASENIPIKSL